MTEPSSSLPPRPVPDRPFPAYAYIPGRTPHPTRDPDGHSYGAVLASSEPPDPPNPVDWRACRGGRELEGSVMRSSLNDDVYSAATSKPRRRFLAEGASAVE